MANIGYNPFLTTNIVGSFSISTSGHVQGCAYDDAASRNYLAGGTLALTESYPMWGGVAISETIPSLASMPRNGMGPFIGRATSVANLSGFSVFNQAVHMINTPQSECPTAQIGTTVQFYRFGSNARIPVAIDPALVSLDGGLTTQQVSWDFFAQRLIPYYPTTGNIAITAMSWANTNGGTVSVTTTSAHNLSVGSDFTITGAVPTAYNGSWTVATAPTTTTLTFLLPAASTPGAVTTLGSVLGGGGALPVRVLGVDIGTSKTVVWDPVNQFAHWNNSGSTALILI